MKIEKYRYLTNGKYKVTIDDKDYIIYEDVILKYNILALKEIDEKKLGLYLKDNDYYEAYYLAIKYIKTKLRTPKEVRVYLLKNNYAKTIIDKVILKLESDKYLDDNVYTVSYINDQIYLKNVGPLKIKNDLEKLGIDKTIILENLKIYTKEKQEEKIEKYIKKEIKLNKNKSEVMLKNNILNKLINKGFYKEDILKYLDNVSIDEKDLYKKEYDKLYNKLSKKYSGKELEFKIRQKLSQKGFYNN